MMRCLYSGRTRFSVAISASRREWLMTRTRAGSACRWTRVEKQRPFCSCAQRLSCSYRRPPPPSPTRPDPGRSAGKSRPGRRSSCLAARPESSPAPVPRRARIAQAAQRVQAARAEVVAAAFDERELEGRRGIVSGGIANAENPLQQRQIFLIKLVLQVDGIGGNDHPRLVLQGVQNRRDEVGYRFARAGACFHHQMVAVVEGGSHCASISTCGARCS